MIMIEPDELSRDIKRACLVEVRAENGISTDVYRINGSPLKELFVSRALCSSGGDILIRVWDQPDRAWTTKGEELRIKGCGEPPPMTKDQLEALDLLFRELRLEPVTPFVTSAAQK